MKKITREEFEKVITSAILLGKSSNKAAKDAGVGQPTAMGVIRVFELMRSGDLEALRKEAERSGKISRTMVALAAEKLGMEAPADVMQAINARMAKELEHRKGLKAKREYGLEPAGETKETPPSQPKAAATPPLAGEAKGNDAVYFIRILEELHQQNESLNDLLDVVLPKYVSDLKDNLNANADVIGQDLRGCLEELKAIRCNTRKRGL